MIAARKKGWTLTGRHVLAIVVGFFVVVFAANGVFLWLSLSSHPGVSEEDAYRRGMKYNREIERRERERALGWKVAVSLDAGRPVLRLSDAAGAPLATRTVTAEARRPTHDGEDRRLRFVETGAGLYRFTGEPLAPGRWTLLIEIAGMGQPPFLAQAAVMVPR